MGKKVAAKSRVVTLEVRYLKSRPDSEFPSRLADMWEVVGTVYGAPVKEEVEAYWDGDDFAGWKLPPSLDSMRPTDKQRLLDQIEPKGPQGK